MTDPLASKIVSGIGIKSTGIGLQIQNRQNDNTIFLVDVIKPFITAFATFKATSIITGGLDTTDLIIGNPPISISTALLHIYDNDAGLEPQLVIEQDGSGNVGTEFLLSGLISYMEGIDNLATNNPFKIAFSIGGDALLGTNDILIIDAISNNISLGNNTLIGLTSGINNLALGEDAGENITTTNNNIFIQNSGVLGDDGKIRIGNINHNNTFIEGIYGVTPGGPPQTVIIDANGELGSSSTAGSGDVTGPAGATDTAIAVYNGGTGKVIKNSGVIIDGSDNIIIPTELRLLESAAGLDNYTGFKAPADLSTTNIMYTLPSAGGADGQFLQTNASDVLTWATIVGGGDVTGPAGATDTAIPRYSGGTGKIIQDSSVLIDGSDNVTGVVGLTATGNIQGLDLIATDELRLRESAGGLTEFTGFKAPAVLGSDIIYTLPLVGGADGQFLQTNTSNVLIWATPAGSGDVTGPGASTVNRLALFADASGTLLKQSTAIIDVSGDLSGLIGLEVSGGNNINLTSTLASSPSIVLNANHASGGIEIQQQGTSRVKTNATGLSFFNSTPIAKPNIAGTRNGNAALADLLTDLASFGLITDSTTAGTSPGDVTGPAGATDTAIPRYSGTTGKIIQDSSVLIDGSNNITIPGEMRIVETGAGTEYIGFKAPAAITGNTVYTFPEGSGTAGQVLQTAGGTDILSWVTPSATAELSDGYITGFIVSDASASTKTVSAGTCRSDDDTTDITGGPFTPDITASGANGLDTGSEAVSTWYSIWIIAGGGNPVASLLSVSISSPTLPGTYTVKRRIGWVRNDGSSDFLDYYSTSEGRDRFYLYTEIVSVLIISSALTATIFTGLTLVRLIPPTCTLAYVNTNLLATAPGSFTEFIPTGSGLGSSAHRCYSGKGGSGDSTSSTCFHIQTDVSQSIDYKNDTTGNTGDLWVLGFTDSI